MILNRKQNLVSFWVSCAAEAYLSSKTKCETFTMLLQNESIYILYSIFSTMIQSAEKLRYKCANHKCIRHKYAQNSHYVHIHSPQKNRLRFNATTSRLKFTNALKILTHRTEIEKCQRQRASSNEIQLENHLSHGDHWTIYVYIFNRER